MKKSTLALMVMGVVASASVHAAEVYNKDGNKKEGYELSLNGDDKGTSEKLEKLKTWELEYGDYISLYASDLNEPDSTTNITPQQPSTDENPNERNI